MELFRPRSSSIPRQYRQIPAAERFTVTDAAELKLKLQALDDKLEPGVDAATLASACQSRPFHEEIYVDGSEEFYLLVKSITRADLIPQTYIKAYAAVQQGRFPLNHYNVSDFRKGVDPTFSDLRPLLSKIDQLCGTKLVKPFPFLALPAELANQVYSHVLPREPHIALLYQPLREHKPPRVRLDIMSANRQLHNETRKYFYENRTLFMLLARDKKSQMLSNEYISRYYETLAVMNAETRCLFTRLEVLVAHFSEQTFKPRQYQLVRSVADPMQHIVALLPNLTSIIITLGPTPIRPLPASLRVAQQRNETLEWFLKYIPPHVEILWEQSTIPAPELSGDSQLRDIVDNIGSFIHGESATARLEASRRSMNKPDDWKELRRCHDANLS
ncbi:hypothetical protein DE146DRAFT_617778 [Phaeosphaeria sp. MPI-PUGE-AT-0046c]|nr:hypothetical protein DE146DRAFT_617778 [Phaeosphaeria sp. MPI-PUGE-AT-0046c]